MPWFQQRSIKHLIRKLPFVINNLKCQYSGAERWGTCRFMKVISEDLNIQGMAELIRSGERKLLMFLLL